MDVKNDGRRISRELLAEIYALAKSKNWTEKNVRDFAHEAFGKHPDSLTRREALALLQYLQK